MKKLIIITLTIVVLFVVAIFLSNMSNQKKEGSLNATERSEQPTNNSSTNDSLDEYYQNQISLNALKEKIVSGEPVIAYFYSPECPHCREMTPRLMPIAEEMNVYIDQLNLLHYDAGWDDFHIEYTPTLIYFKDGKEVERTVGAQPNEVIQTFLKKVELKEE